MSNKVSIYPNSEGSIYVSGTTNRTVRLNVNDNNADEGSIDPDLITVVVDEYDGNLLNTPNDLVISDGYLYFTGELSFCINDVYLLGDFSEAHSHHSLHATILYM